MDLTEFNKSMGIRSLIGAIIVFVVAIWFRCNNIAYFGIAAEPFSLAFSIMGGWTLIIAFDYYNNGAVERPFGLIPLYLIGIILGAIIYYLVIANIPLDFMTQVQSFLRIEAVR